MQLDDFQFELPLDLIARYPTARRSESRLMYVNGHQRALHHHQFHEVVNFINPGDLLVFNDTKVIPARLMAYKTTGGKVEILVERILSNERMLAQIRASKSPRVGESIFLNERVSFVITNRENQFFELHYQNQDQTMLEVIEALGQIPLPPYMQREPEESDKERYQTVYAKHKGSVAAPTAGFHFDEDLLAQLRAKQVDTGYLTLHIGAGTFAPIRVLDIRQHKMHAEYLEVPAVLCAQIEATKARGNRVISVGTTSLRALETASQSGKVEPYEGETRIFIYPGYEFHCVDALITNLHLPKSTLLMLVCAFGGHQPLMQAYREAVTQGYRFYSYGDVMWIERASMTPLSAVG